MSFPLGDPVNRPKRGDLIPVPGRPNWWTDRQGSEPKYIEPARPPVPNGHVPPIERKPL